MSEVHRLLAQHACSQRNVIVYGSQLFWFLVVLRHRALYLQYEAQSRGRQYV